MRPPQHRQGHTGTRHSLAVTYHSNVIAGRYASSRPLVARVSAGANRPPGYLERQAGRKPQRRQTTADRPVPAHGTVQQQNQQQRQQKQLAAQQQQQQQQRQRDQLLQQQHSRQQDQQQHRGSHQQHQQQPPGYAMQQWGLDPQQQKQQQSLPKEYPLHGHAPTQQPDYKPISGSSSSTVAATVSSNVSPNNNEEQQQLQPSTAHSAYSVVPTPTAPAVAAAAATTAASSTASAEGQGGFIASAADIPPAGRCVPRHFWGLMNEEMRPWHRQVLVHLCYRLPPPACHNYRDMKAVTMQGILAQRAVLEKQLREHYENVSWQQRRLRGWLDKILNEEKGFVNPESLGLVQQELLAIKSAIGSTKTLMRNLQLKARTYRDTGYCQYSDQFAPPLRQLDWLCDTARQQQVDVVLEVQAYKQQAARRIMFARTSAELATVQQAAAAEMNRRVQEQRPLWQSAQQQLSEVRQQLRSMGWRYPPKEYILWRGKGQVGASGPPLVLPGLGRRLPVVRQNVDLL